MARKLGPKALVKRGERALKELELGILSKADRRRIDFVWQALRALDEDRARIKADLDALEAETG